ncbi:MAG: hypothetical protein HFE77_03745 [Clostridiales bacterium]|nr:hypothetical protein [Clostridiales bacterium]
MKNWNFFMKIAVLVFLLFGIITTVQLNLQISELKKTATASRSEIDSLNDDIDELIDEIEQPIDENYIMKFARESLNYHLPSEIVYYNDMTK